MSNFEKVKKLILQLEKGQETMDNTLVSISKIVGKNIDPYVITNYWRSENLDNFVKRLVAPSIDNWQDINDARAIVLIKEILENLGDDAILSENADALEKRYSKPTGTITDYIFYQNISEANEMLKLLKKNTVISL